jgi:large subunit ribosomal protein L24e
MVLKRQCSFCAGEVEPGTGTMFVKRDGSVFYFCTSSCRKQQMNLGRVGHRLKWTRAHTMKVAAEQSSATARGVKAAAAAAPKGAAPSAKPAAAAPAKSATPAPADAAPAPKKPATTDAATPTAPTAEPKDDASPKKPRAKKPKTPATGESA